MSELHYEIRVGRLIELRMPPALTPTDALWMKNRGTELVMKAKTRLVAIVDVRHGHVYPPPIADALVTMMRAQNAAIERTALIVDGGATFSLQAERMLKEANHPARRPFRKVSDAITWLGEVLDPPEQKRLREFLG